MKAFAKTMGAIVAITVPLCMILCEDPCGWVNFIGVMLLLSLWLCAFAKN